MSIATYAQKVRIKALKPQMVRIKAPKPQTVRIKAVKPQMVRIKMLKPQKECMNVAVMKRVNDDKYD